MDQSMCSDLLVVASAIRGASWPGEMAQAMQDRADRIERFALAADADAPLRIDVGRIIAEVPEPHEVVPVRFLVRSSGEATAITCVEVEPMFHVDGFPDDIDTGPTRSTMAEAVDVAVEVNRRKARLAEMRAEETRLRREPIGGQA